MGKNDLEPRGVAAVWPLTQQPRNQDALLGLNRTEGSDLNLAALWRIAWTWRWLLLGAVAAGIAGGVIFTLLTTPLYRSEAVIEINPPSVEVMDGGKAGPVAQNDQAFVQTQSGLLRSRSLAARVVQDLNLASNEALVPDPNADRATRQRIATNLLNANLKVESDERSRLIKISYSSADPQLAAKIVNGFADSYIRTSLERRYQASSYARDFLQKQIGTVRRELETSERQLVAYAQQQGIIRTGAGESATSDTASLTGTSLVELNKALADAETKRIAAEQAYRESTASSATVEISERTADLRNQRAKLESDYREKATIFRPDYPELQSLKARITAIDEAIRTEAGSVRAGQSGTRRADYQAALSTENTLRSRVEQLRGQVLDLRGRSIQYTILQRDVDTNRSLYEALLQRYKEIGVAGGVGVSNASVVDRGDVPSSPYKPNLMVNLLLGMLIGAGIGLGTALAVEFINDTIKTPDDVRDDLELAFLGGIPVSKGKRPTEALREANSPISEAYFSAAMSLQFTTDGGVPRVLLVTSTRPAEGKSTSTWALAQHFARLGRRVLLIDADMRKPAFVTGREKEDGLSNLLTTHDLLNNHVQQTDVEGLWLLPCGPIPPNPAELLSSPRLRAILAEATSAFDMVVIDGPPILGLADSPLLSTVCQATLMVVEAGKTRTRAAVEALNRIRSSGGNVVGALLTRYRHEATGYGYNYEAYSYRSVENRNREIRAIGGRAE
ncbi:polysaccharide biosynthesis tyrosine autokinase [Sphingomonas sp. LM7]|uniref:GumC family protein n=1 Tax=Sphingomonas sp. LM7 TaxID=1938607 RepID=UPI000983F105|nr:polysaccharide biosynthesis tyrosine autokinase [Sphingomonas sp. LM7]AQR75549.1 capsular biosynthesis protein [Sphingomonas sp. LM7]